MGVWVWVCGCGCVCACVCVCVCVLVCVCLIDVHTSVFKLPFSFAGLGVYIPFVANVDLICATSDHYQVCLLVCKVSPASFFSVEVRYLARPIATESENWAGHGKLLHCLGCPCLQAMGEDYGLDVTCVWGETGSTAVDAKKMGEGGEELKKREEGPSKAGGGGGGDAGAGAGGREARPAQKGG